MKLIIQIPCYNEEATLPETLADLPTQIDGIDVIEWLVIDDGSTDGTAEVAHANGVHHIVQHVRNKGLASAFKSGLEEGLSLGADIIVNTDADNQYPGTEIPRLIAPILNSEADMVIADRQIAQIDEFSSLKKVFQSWGSWVVRVVSGTNVPDAPSGFRAFSREAALRLNIVTRYTYTLETIIQAGKKNLKIAHIPITTNPKTRDSRLMRNNFHYILRSSTTILRLYTLYEPLRTFFYLGLVFLLIGLAPILRFVYLYLTDQSGIGRHIQSITIGGTLLIVGVIILIVGILADLVAINRQLLEEILYRQKMNDLAPQRADLEERDK